MRFLLLPVGFALLAGLAACSTGVPSASPSAGASTPSAPSTAASSGGGAHSTGPVAVCADFPVSVIAAATGRSVYTTATERDGPSQGAQLYSCEYTDTAPADALNGFDIAVYRGGDATAILAALSQAQTAGTTPLSGLGDRAQVGAGEVDVARGSDVIAVADAVHDGTLADVPASALEALARKVLARL